MESTASSTPTTSTDPKTNAAIAWIFSPISSYVFKDDKDEFVRKHAHESFYFGVASVAVAVILMFLSICFTFTVGLFFVGPISIIGSFLSCLWGLLVLAVFLFLTVPRVIGVIKAFNMEPYGIRTITEFVQRFIKL